MKILDVTEFYSDRGGGVRSHLTARAHVLYQRGHDHLVVAPGARDEESGDAVRPPHLLRVKGPALPYDPSYHLLWRFDKVRDRIAREHPDVLEIHSPYVAAASALSVARKDFGVRTFQWHADFVDTYLRPFLHKSTRRKRNNETGAETMNLRLTDAVLEPLWAWVRAIGRGSDATLVAARWQVEKLEAHGVPRVHRVPFGIDKDAFRPDRASADVRAELLHGAPPETQLLVGVGRFATEKRWDVVLDAFLRLRSTAPSIKAKLVMFGDGPERARMEARVSGCTDVHFMGFEKSREKLAASFASADVLVHGCPYETYGLSIAEALSSGLAAVVPDEGGAAEMVDGGAGGRHYRALDVDDCTQAVASLLAVPAADRRAGALAAAAKVPTVAESVDQTVRIYEAMLVGPRSSMPRSAK